MKYTKLQKSRTTYFKVGVRNKRCRGHNLYADVNEEEGKQLIEEAMGQGLPLLIQQIHTVSADQKNW